MKTIMSVAWAHGAASGSTGSTILSFLPFILIFVIFYFLLILPQQKRQKKLKAMLAVWDRYVRENNVVLPDRSLYEAMEKPMPTRVPDDAGYPPLLYKGQFIPPKDMLATPKP